LRLILGRSKYEFDGKESRVTASIGVSIYPDHGETGDELLKRADEALYRSKSSGRDRVTVYRPEAPGGR
jgi:diguanylate cyclase (GGDEF)-like protein